MLIAGRSFWEMVFVRETSSHSASAAATESTGRSTEATPAARARDAPAGSGSAGATMAGCITHLCP